MSSIVDLTPPNEYCTRASFVLLDVIMSKHIYFGTCAAAFLCNGRGRKLNKVAFLFTYKLSLVINLRGNFLSQANPYRAKKIPSRALAFQFLSKNYIQCNLDLVTHLVSAKTVTKLHNVTKSNDFM